jgi:outer membrane lipoprotein-sorting protein
MRQTPFILALMALLIIADSGQSAKSAPVAGPAVSELKAVLARMDKAADTYGWARADFKWEDHGAVNQTEVESGQIHFERKGDNQEVDLRMLAPHRDEVVIKSNRAAGYEARANQPIGHEIEGSDPGRIMGAVALGLKGKDLRQGYDVAWGDWETVDNIRTARLELVSREERIRRVVRKVILWIDPNRAVAVQQEILEPSGDYRLAHYSNIVLDKELVLAQMDKAGKNFKSAEADFKQEQYTEVVRTTDEQTGHIFVRRKGKEQEVAINVLTPHPKQVVIKNNQATMYDPRLNQTTERKIDSSDAQSVMNAFAFGVKGEDLKKDYEITFAGMEPLDGVQTARLELVARKEKMRNFFNKVILWIDLEQDVPIQQKRLESSGDYQLARYNHIVRDHEIPEDVFVIKKKK